MDFAQFPIHKTLLENIRKTGFSEATAIQKEVLPHALKGSDISGLSRTGTGKTCAFLIPTIHRLLELPESAKALCLAPTRELALQIEMEIHKLGKGMPIGVTCAVGGMPAEQQVKKLNAGSRFIVGTPGRTIDHIRTKALSTKNIQILIFDEADRMFDMGFIDDMKFILQKIHPERQVLLFSATLNFTVLNLMYSFGVKPIEINISKDEITPTSIQQKIYHIGKEEKPIALITLCQKVKKGSIIIFVNYRESVDWVASLLEANGIKAKGISSLLHQDKRNQILKSFRNRQFQALVATDVASRGLDIDDVNLVVNYHLPEEAANYVHRTGRTARAGKSGLAASIAGPDDVYNQLKIEQFLGKKIPMERFNSEELNTKIKKPRRSTRGSRHHSSTSNNHRAQSPSRASSSTTPMRKKELRKTDRYQKGKTSSRSKKSASTPSTKETQAATLETIPFPITGSPIIYCTRTGKLKESPINMAQADAYTGKQVNLLKKIGSTVTSIFHKR